MTQARLNAITDSCKAPRDWLELRGREVVFRADPNGDLEKIECVLKKMSAAIDMNNLLFVGNAQPAEDK